MKIFPYVKSTGNRFVNSRGAFSADIVGRAWEDLKFAQVVNESDNGERSHLPPDRSNGTCLLIRKHNDNRLQD